jgi:protoheme ferro-lyase
MSQESEIRKCKECGLENCVCAPLYPEESSYSSDSSGDSDASDGGGGDD